MTKKYLTALAMAAALAAVISGCGGSAQTESAAGQTAADTEAKITEKAEEAAAKTGTKGADQGEDGAESEEGEGDAGLTPKPGMPLQKGNKAPDFTAELADGTSLTLSEFQGKPVIINFWATWCGPCVKEMPAFERLKEDFGDKIGIIAVNCGDDSDTVKDFIEKNGYTFPVALDEDYAVSMLYPTNGIPYTVILDEEGTVTHLSTGASDADTMYEMYKEALGL